MASALPNLSRRTSWIELNALAVTHNVLSKGVAAPPLDEVLQRARCGETLPEGEAAALAGAAGVYLEELCSVAAGLRDRGKGKTVTFSPKPRVQRKRS